MSSLPNSSAAFCTSRSGTPSFVRSPPNTLVSPRISPAACSARSPSRSLTRTRAPSAASSSAVARPMPRADPVTIAALPSRTPTGHLLVRLTAGDHDERAPPGRPFAHGEWRDDSGVRRPRPLVALVEAALPRDPCEGGERGALHPDGREGALHLARELAREEREVERHRHALARGAPAPRQLHRGLEELLHPERRGYLDPGARRPVADVLELVRLAGGHHDDVTRPGDDRLAAEPESHAAAPHLEALLLLGVHVLAGHVPVGGQLEVDLEQLAARVGRGPAEGDPLATDRVLDDLTCVCHVLLLGRASGGPERFLMSGRTISRRAPAVVAPRGDLVATPRGWPARPAGGVRLPLERDASGRCDRHGQVRRIEHKEQGALASPEPAPTPTRQERAQHERRA